jgi:cytochrome P450
MQTSANAGLPVLDRALPVLGHMPEMYRSFPGLCARGVARCGPAFWIHGGPGARQLMVADEAALALLKSSTVSTGFYAEGFGALLGNSLLAFDGDQHRRIRQALSPPFTPQKVRQSDVLDIVCDAVQKRIETWPDKRAIRVAGEVGEIALEVIFRLMGVPVEQLAEWRKQYGRFILAGIPSTKYFPSPIQWVAVRAREWLDERLGEIVDQRRRSGDTTTLVGEVANAKDEDGNLLDRALVVTSLRLLSFAGHETTASSIAWCLLHVAADSDAQRRLVQEARAVDDVKACAMNPNRMSFAESAFREAMRLYPPLHSVVRRATAPLGVPGGVVPAGTLVNVPFVHLLRDPVRFPRPEEFRVERWTERPRPGTLETAMFGAGPHFCLGYHVAIAEGTLFILLLGRLLARKGLTLEIVGDGKVPRPVYLPLIHPPSRSELRLVPSPKGSS